MAEAFPLFLERSHPLQYRFGSARASMISSHSSATASHSGHVQPLAACPGRAGRPRLPAAGAYPGVCFQSGLSVTQLGDVVDNRCIPLAGVIDIQHPVPRLTIAIHTRCKL